MSLDVSLELDQPIRKKRGSGIFVRESGQTKEISWDEWNRRYPGRTPVTLKSDDPSEDYYETNKVWSGNITHNLGEMARQCGAYQVCWHPEEIGVTKARQAVFLLSTAIANLGSDPDKHKQYNPENGWGSYEVLLEFLKSYYDACYSYPEAKISTSI